MESIYYHQELLVFGDEEHHIVGKRVLAGASREGHQEVVVHKVVPTYSNQHKCLAHELLGVFSPDHGTHFLLILLEVLQLPQHPYNVQL